METNDYTLIHRRFTDVTFSFHKDAVTMQRELKNYKKYSTLVDTPVYQKREEIYSKHWFWIVELSRINGISDNIFAFAMILLVQNLTGKT
jgi:hypothetical protein